MLFKIILFAFLFINFFAQTDVFALQKNVLGRGVLIVVSAPSGTGKTTIIDGIIEEEKNYKRVIPITTQNLENFSLKDYRIISKEAFEELLRDNQFCAVSVNDGRYVGILKDEIISILDSGKNAFVEIEYDGFFNLKYDFYFDKNSLISFYLLPPSFDELKRRLELKKDDNSLKINEKASKELQKINHHIHYDYTIINADAKKTKDTIVTIVALKSESLNALNPLRAELANSTKDSTSSSTIEEEKRTQLSQ